MKELQLEVPQRSAVLYVRVTERNKQYVEDLADEYEISTSNFINNILTQVREQNDNKKVNIAKRAKKAK